MISSFVFGKFRKHPTTHDQFCVLIQKIQIFLDGGSVRINQFLDGYFLLFHDFPIRSDSVDVGLIRQSLIAELFSQFKILIL
jgi:hypothetical protein